MIQEMQFNRTNEESTSNVDLGASQVARESSLIPAAQQLKSQQGKRMPFVGL
jgi:hypothetical protein